MHELAACRTGIAGGVPGGYTGRVIRDPPSTLKAEASDSEAGPGSPEGWSGWSEGAAPASPVPTLRARSPTGSLGLGPLPGNTRLLANKGEI